MIDPILPLAIGMAEGKAIYALFLGSGVSQEAGIATGIEIFWDTIRIIYRDREGKEPDAQQLKEWFEASELSDYGYSKILQTLFPAVGERHQFLTKYFEDKDPGPSHRYIAEMVEKGLVKVILTTNFDPLMERALDEKKIPYCLVASNDAVKNVTPLEHARCWIVKLHGDYQQQNIKNTPKELATLDSAIEEKSREIVDRHGLVVIGYSGSDKGVMSILRSRFPRYTIYWLSQSGEVNDDVKSLIQQQDGRLIQDRTASAFLLELLRRVGAYESTEGGNTVDEMLRLMKEIVRRNDSVQYLEELKHQYRLIRQMWPKLYEESKGYVHDIDIKELKKIVHDAFLKFSNYAEPVLGIGLVLIEHSKFEWINDLSRIFQYFMDTYEDVEGTSGEHVPALQPIPIGYAGFIWWVWCSLAFNKEQWETVKKLRQFRVHSYSSRSSILLSDTRSFVSRALWDIDNTILQTQAEKEFICDYFRNKERFIDALVEVNFVLGLLAVKDNMVFQPWFRMYYFQRLNSVSDRLKSDFAFTTDIAKNLFDESYDSFTSNFAERCDVLYQYQSQHWDLENESPRNLFTQKPS